MTEFTFNNLVKPTKVGKNAQRGTTEVYVGQVGKPLDPLNTEGWFRLGRAVSVPDLATDPGALPISAGGTKALLLNLPQEQIQEAEFTFDMFTLQAMQLSHAADVALTFNYSSTGQTTVASGGTTTGATLTDGSDFAVNDFAIVDNIHATYGGFPEMVVITKVTGNVVEFDPPLSVAPPNSTTFKKVAGSATGTDKDDTGIRIANTLIETFPRRQILMVTNDPSSKSRYHEWIPELEITKGSRNKNETLKTISFAGTPIIQDPITVDLEDGTTASRNYYSLAYMVPTEST